MAYALAQKSQVARDLAGLPAAARARVVGAIADLADEPRPRGAKKLRGSGSSRYRIRIGDYRVVYEVDDNARAVTILAVGHRREVYR